MSNAYSKQLKKKSTILNLTWISGAVTLQGTISSSPSVVRIISGIFVCSLINGFCVSAIREENHNK